MKMGSLLSHGSDVRTRRPRRGRWYGLVALAVLLLSVAATACARSGGASSGDAPEPQPHMSIENPRGEMVSVPFTVSGWAVDLAAAEGSGIDVVQILDEGCEGAVIGIAEYGLGRPDIGRRYSEQFQYSGWQFQVERLRQGDHTLAVRAMSAGADDYNQCQAIQITVEYSHPGEEDAPTIPG